MTKIALIQMDSKQEYPDTNLKKIIELSKKTNENGEEEILIFDLNKEELQK
jgi:predicted amidohydrolase